MAHEYATLAELKAIRRRTDTDDDATLQAALTRASRAIDKRCGRRFWLDEAPSSRVYDPTGRVVVDEAGELLLVDDIGDAAGLVVEVGPRASGPWSTVDGIEPRPLNAAADSLPVTGLYRPLAGWRGCLTAVTRVRITARFGWPAIPEEIVQATLILAPRLYGRKDSPEGIIGSNEWGTVRLSRSDPDVEALIGPYILPGFGA